MSLQVQLFKSVEGSAFYHFTSTSLWQNTETQTSNHEEQLAETKEDESVTPLAIPLLAGPGAITTTLLFTGKTDDIFAVAVMIAGAALVFALSYLFFHWAEKLADLIGSLGMKIITRLMGFFLAFIAVQYVIDGIQAMLIR